MLKNLRKKIQPKKIIVCSNCKTKLQFPIKKSVKLNVKCPKCNAQYTVSFVNPITQLLKRQITWQSLSKQERIKIITLLATLAASLWLIISSLISPIVPNQSVNGLIEFNNVN